MGIVLQAVTPVRAIGPCRIALGEARKNLLGLVNETLDVNALAPEDDLPSAGVVMEPLVGPLIEIEVVAGIAYVYIP